MTAQVGRCVSPSRLARSPIGSCALAPPSPPRKARRLPKSLHEAALCPQPTLRIEQSRCWARLRVPTRFMYGFSMPNIPSFAPVESFFRNVVDPVVEEAGMSRIEIGTDKSDHAFMNVAIFESLHFASLADCRCHRRTPELLHRTWLRSWQRQPRFGHGRGGD